MDYSHIIGVSVFLEQRSARVFVGTLEKNNEKYMFSYSNHYLNYKKAIPLGPELPLTQQSFEAEKIFPSFEDRIPSKGNPEYPNYCKQFGIDPDEKDILILLASIGKKGPSSFMFEPKWGEGFSSDTLKEFRNKLGLSTRDFAESFGFSQATIVRTENRMASGAEILKLLELLYNFPDVAAWYVERYADSLHSKKKEKLISMLRAQQFGCWGDVLTDHEYNFSKAAAETLKDVSWAEKILKDDKIKKALEYEMHPNSQDISTTKAALFKVRFSLALYESKLDVAYGHKTGLGEALVDFMVQKPEKTNPKWFIELTGLNQFDDAIGDTNSAEVRDIIKTQQAILNKVTKTDENGKVEMIKFPKMTEEGGSLNVFHAIIVDIRSFNMGISDVAEYINILYGREEMPDEYKRYWTDKGGKKKLIRGLFDNRHPDPRSKILQENIHMIGFAKEKCYAKNEINSEMKIYANIHLISQDEIQKLWPL